MNRNNLDYRQTTKALIRDRSGQFLLIQKQTHKENQWDLPGGGIEQDELPETTIRRELKEELGSENFTVISQSEISHKYEWPDDLIKKDLEEKRTSYRGQVVTNFLVEFTGDRNSLKPQESEIRKVAWVSADELPTYLIFSSQLKYINKLVNEFLGKI